MQFKLPNSLVIPPTSKSDVLTKFLVRIKFIIIRFRTISRSNTQLFAFGEALESKDSSSVDYFNIELLLMQDLFCTIFYLRLRLLKWLISHTNFNPSFHPFKGWFPELKLSYVLYMVLNYLLTKFHLNRFSGLIVKREHKYWQTDSVTFALLILV